MISLCAAQNRGKIVQIIKIKYIFITRKQTKKKKKIITYVFSSEVYFNRRIKSMEES